MNHNKETYSDVLNTFVNLIGYITIIIHFDSYSESKKKYEDILNIIVKWMVEYEQKRTVDFIDLAELTCVYKDLDELQTKYICNDSMASESEFSDFSLNWMQHFVTIYKNNVLKGEK